MNPSLAVIFLTLFSGSGFGLMAAVAAVNDFHIDGGLSPLRTAIAVVLALLLVTIGMISSTAHLANPKNAWRAFSRWRTSWLAREGIFAVLFYPLAIAYLGWVFFLNTTHGSVALILGNSAAIVALVTIFCQGMIYACLRTIRQWHTPLVPANFYVLGLALGMTILATARLIIGGPDRTLIGISIALLIAAAVMKAIYYFWIGRPSGTTLQTATGFSRGKVRLLDQGHTFGTFLTREFSNSITPSAATRFKIAVYVLGFTTPIGILMLGLHEPIGMFALLAPLSAFIGIGMERYLFFVEAQHVVNLYHGRAPSSMPMMRPVSSTDTLAQQQRGRLVPSYQKR
ncbi:MAG: dimethyl sulfoxide reductase anchor subunit family protein [Acidiferrobacter sp.]